MNGDLRYKRIEVGGGVDQSIKELGYNIERGIKDEKDLQFLKRVCLYIMDNTNPLPLRDSVSRFMNLFVEKLDEEKIYLDGVAPVPDAKVSEIVKKNVVNKTKGERV